ncbi:MAG: hypothetical protein ACSLE0_07840 [Chitinophagaceae bacterium]
MKKRLISLSSIFILVSMLHINCSKEDSPAPPSSKTKTELITKAAWKFSDAKVNGSSVSAFLQTCQKDNILTFLTAGTGTADEGPSKCDPSDPQTNPFTWNFQTNETILFVSTPFFSGGSSNFTLVSLTETELVISQNINVSGSTQNAVITFLH